MKTDDFSHWVLDRQRDVERALDSVDVAVKAVEQRLRQH